VSQPGAVGGARSGPSVEGAARGHGRSNLVLASLLVTTVSATLAIVDPRLRHWFMLPVTACGALIAVDAVGWLRRQLDIFDPQAILSWRRSSTSCSTAGPRVSPRRPSGGRRWP